MNEPIISKDFTIEDIRKIRDYNSQRHLKMTAEEIIAERKETLKMLYEQGLLVKENLQVR